MHFNIWQNIHEHKKYIFEKFTDRYLFSLQKLSNQESSQIIIKQYGRIIDTLANEHSGKEDIYKEFDRLTDLNLELKTPYVVLINEMQYLQNTILEVIAENELKDGFKEVMDLFTAVNHNIANRYLDGYIESLLSTNNVRINSISEIINKNIVKHYQAHLVWLNNIANSIKNKDKENFSELDPNLCDFGNWLNAEGKNIIQNGSKHKAIIALHDSLHMFAQKIYAQMDNDDFHIFITYLEKCELLSLNIGTELAFLDNILMNNQITKDPLTKALNRHALSQIFASQYDIALATSNSFVMAMCDLDHFKYINDTFGHLAGDKMLVEFVKIVKNKLRNSDMIIRFGGEEFIILLPAVKQERGFEILDSIREAFSKFVLDFDNKKINTTLSMGILEIEPAHQYKEEFLEDYIDITDKKLYRAKTAGRNQICV